MMVETGLLTEPWVMSKKIKEWMPMCFTGRLI